MNEEKEMRPEEETASQVVAPAQEETQAPKTVEVVGVGFRTAGKTYYFSPKQYQLTVGTPVVVETARGVELGKIMIANRMVSEKEIVSPLREITRPANQNDLARHEDNQRLELRAAEICRQKIAQHKLEMDLVSVEYTFDNSKLLFYFTAENRVDFRELVKDLASVFKTRIELRQIGIRDEAKMMGGFGVCGRPFCCSSFLSDFVQVSIKMAKEQNFSLNSAKISGACGRLMCCLRYEHDVYEEAIKLTPSVGSYVSTPNGLGTVVETRPLTAGVKVKLDEKNEAAKLYAVKDVKVLRSKGKSGLQPEDGVMLEGAQTVAPAAVPASAEVVTQKTERNQDRHGGARKNNSRPPRKKNYHGQERHQNRNEQGTRGQNREAILREEKKDKV